VRTTVTLDPDVELLLKQTSRRTRQSFKQVLNRAVREGLRASSPATSPKRFVVKARRLRLRPGIDPVNIGRLGDALELAAFLKTTRQLKKLKR
jgi:hypothetical protein